MAFKKKKKPDLLESDNVLELVTAADKMLKQNALPQTDFTLHTGCHLLDWAIRDGLPGGTWMEISGAESSGKTTLSLLLAKACQAQGGLVVFLDMEGSMDLSWAKHIGVNIEDKRKWYCRQPESLEDCLEIIEHFGRNRAACDLPTLIIWDSVAISASREDLPEEKSLGDSVVALEPRKISRFFKRGITRKIAGSKVSILALNQVRDKIGSYIKETDTPGGRALKFAAHVRLSVRPGKAIEDSKKRRVGHFVHIDVKKNKRDPGGRSCIIPFYKASGFDNSIALINWLIMTGGIVKGSTGQLKWRDQQWSKASLREAMLGNKDVLEAVKQDAHAAYRLEHP